MKKWPTVSEAKKEVESLQLFIDLAERHETETVQQQVVKHYAYYGSIEKVTEILNKEREKECLPLIDNIFVRELLQSRARDPLHRMLRTAYFKKTRHTRKKSSSMEY